LCEILDVPSKEIAKTQKLPDLFDIFWGLGVFNGFQFVCAGENAVFCEAETEI
jgi:hypothetical protein